MYQENDICVVIIDPGVFDAKQLAQNLLDEIQKLAAQTAEFINESYGALLAIAEKIGEEISRLEAELADLVSVPPNLKRPERDRCLLSNLNHRRLGIVLWYTSGFQ